MLTLAKEQWYAIEIVSLNLPFLTAIWQIHSIIRRFLFLFILFRMAKASAVRILRQWYLMLCCLFTFGQFGSDLRLYRFWTVSWNLCTFSALESPNSDLSAMGLYPPCLFWAVMFNNKCGISVLRLISDHVEWLDNHIRGARVLTHKCYASFFSQDMQSKNP